MYHSGSPLQKPCDINAILAVGLSKNPDEVAIIDKARTLSWRALDERSNRLACHYLELGLKPGDRFASLMPNRAVLIVHYLACLRAGLIANPLTYQYTPSEIARAIADTGASALLVHSERDADVAAAALTTQLPAGVVRYEDGVETSGDLNQLLTNSSPARTLSKISLDSAAFIIHTSGSTGKPKGVTHSVESFGWALASITQGYGLRENDVVMPSSSISRGGGIHITFSTLAAGGKVVVPWSTDPEELLPLMRSYRPTQMGMLPAALFRLVRHKDASKDHFSSLRCMLSGGDKVPSELEDEFTELTGLDIQESYGITELGMVAHNRPGSANRPGSIGKPNPGFSLSLRNDKGEEVEPNQIGRLWVKSPTTTIGYWQNVEATTEAIQAGWFDTGDMMRCDEDGYFWFAGRRSQIIVHDGHNISPQEVEQALLEHPSVALAGVVGIRNLLHGENVRAYITLRRDAERPSESELIAFARERVGYKSPAEIILLNDMPLVGDGKIDRVSLKKMTAEEKDAHHL
ncbi:MAG: class I adenylate-forming enzyme family protein [Pseudomonadota bacterium]